MATVNEPDGAAPSEDQGDRASSAKTWRGVRRVVVAIVVACAVLAAGLVLTGIIAEPETLIVGFFRWIFG